jgi:hypothetical protein
LHQKTDTVIKTCQICGKMLVFCTMNNKVMKLIQDIKSLDKRDHEVFLKWLSDYELSQMDNWDLEIKADSQEDGRLKPILERARKDISENKVKPLDQFLNNT